MLPLRILVSEYFNLVTQIHSMHTLLISQLNSVDIFVSRNSHFNFCHDTKYYDSVRFLYLLQTLHASNITTVSNYYNLLNKSYLFIFFIYKFN